MAEMWQVIPGVNTPVVLLAFLAASIVTAYGIYRWSRYSAIDKKTDSETRYKMLVAIEGQFRPDLGTLTREQNSKIVNDQIQLQKLRSIAGAILGLVAILGIIVVVIVIALNQPAPAPVVEPQKPTTLLLMLEGHKDQEVAKKAPLTINEPHSGTGRRIEFTLANASPGLVIVDELAIEVLDTVEDQTGSFGTVVSQYKYQAELPRRNGTVLFGDKFKYASGEVDRISVGIHAESGADYIVRVVARWIDATTGERRQTVSEPLVLEFPSRFPPEIPMSEWLRLEEEQTQRIKERLQAIKSQK